MRIWEKAAKQMQNLKKHVYVKSLCCASNESIQTHFIWIIVRVRRQTQAFLTRRSLALLCVLWLVKNRSRYFSRSDCKRVLVMSETLTYNQECIQHKSMTLRFSITWPARTSFLNFRHILARKLAAILMQSKWYINVWLFG